MIPTFPQVCDALVASFGQVLGPDLIFDGPPVRDVGASGLAIGATRDDDTTAFVAVPSDLASGITEGLTIVCLAWSGSGSTVFKPARDEVGGILTAVATRLVADRTLGGVVDTADLSGGTWTQEQTGAGGLVTCEFKITVQKF
jgi:hypothetical protein